MILNCLANMDYVYENLVAQMLKSSGNNLYFNLWPKSLQKPVVLPIMQGDSVQTGERFLPAAPLFCLAPGIFN